MADRVVAGPDTPVSISGLHWKLPMLHLIASSFRGQLQTLQAYGRDKEMIRGILLAALIATFAGGAAFAQETCESKAVGKDGKPLAGAAKTSFMKKCMTDTCATKAVSAEGKPLSGAAKNSFIAKCEKGA